MSASVVANIDERTLQELSIIQERVRRRDQETPALAASAM